MLVAMQEANRTAAALPFSTPPSYAGQIPLSTPRSLADHTPVVDTKQVKLNCSDIYCRFMEALIPWGLQRGSLSNGWDTCY